MMGKNDKSAEFADRIVAISGRIADMLGDMLSTLAAEAGQGFDLSFQQQNLVGILSTLQADYQATYGFRLKLNLPTETVMGVFDRQMIIRVMENLISNAFKYGDNESDVTLTVVETESSFILDVHNFGEPIDKNRYADIFQFFKFFEGREILEKRSWGIGLAFVKAITEGHQGHVSVSSDATEGTRFSVNIPKAAFQHGDTKTVTI
jgi:K+-sensing histidine kinase KdpD